MQTTTVEPAIQTCLFKSLLHPLLSTGVDTTSGYTNMYLQKFIASAPVRWEYIQHLDIQINGRMQTPIVESAIQTCLFKSSLYPLVQPFGHALGSQTKRMPLQRMELKLHRKCTLKTFG